VIEGRADKERGGIGAEGRAPGEDQ